MSAQKRTASGITSRDQRQMRKKTSPQSYKMTNWRKVIQILVVFALPVDQIESVLRFEPHESRPHRQPCLPLQATTIGSKRGGRSIHQRPTWLLGHFVVLLDLQSPWIHSMNIPDFQQRSS
jgi:hypothetical protein